jgi:hypothetical protein
MTAAASLAKSRMADLPGLGSPTEKNKEDAYEPKEEND